ncbi:MAG: hypothetical protein JRN59_02490 [Nitrososphaerota archaeon]|jgi:hypothetical protein|nr:hypothetical protein [Nitrososphaerota archaeon]
MHEGALDVKARQIFNFDERIRFIAVLTTEGDVLDEIFRPGVISLEPESDTKMIYTKAGIALGMTSPMDKYHGRVKSVVMNREKVMVICFNRGPKIVLVSVEPGFEKVTELGHLVEKAGIG